MAELTLTINGQRVTSESDKTIFETAVKEDIYIPGLCNHPQLTPSGDCGLCLVQIEGEPKLSLACTTKVTENMVVTTDTPEIRSQKSRKCESVVMCSYCKTHQFRPGNFLKP